jgi:hypothetical protein
MSLTTNDSTEAIFTKINFCCYVGTTLRKIPYIYFIFGLLALSTMIALSDGFISYPGLKLSIEFYCNIFLVESFSLFQDFLPDIMQHDTQLPAVADTQIDHLHEQATPQYRPDPIV